LSGSCPAAIKTRDASKMGCRLELEIVAEFVPDYLHQSDG
jgi:hypothetical protein